MSKTLFVAAAALVLFTSMSGLAQKSSNDEGGRVLGLENAWNHASEAKDTKAMDMLLANTFIAVENDGSVASKSEFLVSIRAPEYQRSQAVNEQIKVQFYGNASVVMEYFRIMVIEKGKPYVYVM